MPHSLKIYAFIALNLMICLGLAHAAEPPPHQRAAIVVSLQIHPYLQAVEGMQAQFESAAVEIEGVYYLNEYEGKSLALLKEELEKAEAGLLVGVGPEAARFIWQQYPGPAPQKIYTMVLNPGSVLTSGSTPCGVSLNIPVIDQVSVLVSALPAVKRIGVIYDPANNRDFVRHADEIMKKTGVSLVLMPVADRKSIRGLLKRNWHNLQGLWLIPDQTVISESIVRYIIKEAILHDIAVYGYNRFFLDSGAAVSFILDYAKIGRQTAELGAGLLEGKSCKRVAPYFETVYNRNVLDRLGLSAAADADGAAP